MWQAVAVLPVAVAPGQPRWAEEAAGCPGGGRILMGLLILTYRLTWDQRGHPVHRVTPRVSCLPPF